MRTLIRTVLAFALLATPFVVDEARGADEDAAATVTVEHGPLGGTIEAKGRIVPATFERVKIEFDAYRGKLEILEAAPEGRVVAGQTLVRFDDEDYRKQRESASRGLQAQRLGLEKAQRLFGLGKDGMAIQRDEVMRARRLADEALERFVTVERKLKEEDAAYGLEGRRIGIQNMREELDQLEKMYTEDDLTEETEEIVLKRNRRNMERMLSSFERWKKRHDYGFERGLKLQHEGLELALRKARLAFERLEATARLDREKAELDLVGARENLRKAEEQFAKLEADAEKFTLKAPMAGMAVRGVFAGGTWRELPSDEAYEAGEEMKHGQVPYTVLDESVMRVHTSVKEDDLATLQVGAPATLTTALTGDDEIAAEVGKVARYGKGDSYEVILRIPDKHERLRAGIACTAKIERRGGAAVLHVPADCVGKHEGKPAVFAPDGTPQPVKLGKRSDGRVEVTEGVEAGQTLLAKPPAPKKKPKKEAGEDADGEKDDK